MKIYIAGKYTGLGHKAAVDKFRKTHDMLLVAGIAQKHIVNPMELGIAEYELWDIALDICLEHLEQCDAIYIQRDWRDSFGARKEITRAMELGLKLYYEEGNDIANLIADYREKQKQHNTAEVCS